VKKRELRHSKFELIREWNLHIKINYSLPVAHTTVDDTRFVLFAGNIASIFEATNDLSYMGFLRVQIAAFLDLVGPKLWLVFRCVCIFLISIVPVIRKLVLRCLRRRRQLAVAHRDDDVRMVNAIEIEPEIMENDPPAVDYSVYMAENSI
jgi:hypothetical protein